MPGTAVPWLSGSPVTKTVLALVQMLRREQQGEQQFPGPSEGRQQVRRQGPGVPTREILKV